MQAGRGDGGDAGEIRAFFDGRRMQTLTFTGFARDEMTAARRAGKPIEFHAADMNHKIALERAKKRGEPAPTNFSGSAAAVFGKR